MESTRASSSVAIETDATGRRLRATGRATLLGALYWGQSAAEVICVTETFGATQNVYFLLPSVDSGGAAEGGQSLTTVPMATALAFNPCGP